MSKFQFLKPDAVLGARAVLDELLKDKKFLALLAATAVTAALRYSFLTEKTDIPDIVLYLLVFFSIGYIGRAAAKVRSRFWQRFAELHGWHYEAIGDPKRETGIMFKQGDSRSIRNVVTGEIDGRPFRVFDYSFTIKHSGPRDDDSSVSYYYTVFAFKFSGKFPHIYLNNKKNSYSVSTGGERVPVPGEFGEKFILYAPRKYEIEALEIFTPNVFAWLLDSEFAHDMELADGEFLIFTEGKTGSFEKLEKEFNGALELEDLLDDKLDRMKFAPIGDMPHTL